MKLQSPALYRWLRAVALVAASLWAVQAQAIIVSSNSDAVFIAPSIRLCSPSEVTVPAGAATLCMYVGINGPAEAFNTVRTQAPNPGWILPSGMFGARATTAEEALRLIELPDLSNSFSVEFINRGQQFVGTWQRDFAGPLLLQVGGFPPPNVITVDGYHYWMPHIDAKRGDRFRFEPGLGISDPIAWINLYTLAPIPEPATVGLMTLGLGLLAWRTQRRRQV